MHEPPVKNVGYVERKKNNRRETYNGRRKVLGFQLELLIRFDLRTKWNQASGYRIQRNVANEWAYNLGEIASDAFEEDVTLRKQIIL